MRIVVTGAGGGLGRAFLSQLPPEHEAVALTRQDLDVRRFGDAVERIVPLRPDVVLHAAAMTSVDGCEQEPRRAAEVNVLGTFNVAYAAERAGARLVTMSTDYVFDGRKEEPYDERDEPRPLAVYGATKLEAERVARAVHPAYLVVRTSWVFGAGDDFFSLALRRLAAGEEVAGIADQVGTPTYVVHLAQRLVSLMASGIRGTVHLAGPEPMTWHRALVRAREIGGLEGEVTEVKAEELDRPAPRPPNSALSSVILPGTDVPPMPPVDDALREALRDVR